MKYFLPYILFIFIYIIPNGIRAQEFANSYALIVGANDYSSLGMQNLSYAESDARRVGDYFKAQGYNVILKTGNEAKKNNIEDAVLDISEIITANDRFVFFFAGHGKSTREQDIDIAYLVLPGGLDKTDPQSLISTGDISRYSRQLEISRHQLFIFVSCYAGLMGNYAFRGEGDAFNSEDFLVEDLSARPAREFLSAGGEDQQVLDGGPNGLSWFTYFFLKGLEPGAVRNRPSGVITFSELASWVQAMSANPVHTPAFGKLSGDHGGQYLFYSTAQGSPQLPPLPSITRQSLIDLVDEI